MLGIIWSIMVISALLLIVLVLMHSPKGDGIAGIHGDVVTLLPEFFRRSVHHMSAMGTDSDAGYPYHM